ncbi:MAG: c-type cytochrome [Gammaproteobacteria bacterium]
MLGTTLSGVAYIYVASETAINHAYAVSGSPVSVPKTPEAIARGRRLAATRGCTGCHGRKAQGSLFLDKPWVARIVTPNLTRSVRMRTNAELEKIIREGVFPDGHSSIAMPSAMFHELSDRDLGDILAYLHSLPLSDGPEEEISLGPLARLGIVLGDYKVQAEQIDHSKPRQVVDRSDPLVYGHYLAKTSCSECHGARFNGTPEMGAPNLAVVAGYSESAFQNLMRTGKPTGERELNLMAEVARSRFRHFTDAEIHALYTFLTHRAGMAPQTSNESE